MKIAFIGQKGIPAIAGGVERHAEELATRLAEVTDNAVIVYTRPWYTDTSVTQYRGVRLVSLPSLYTKHLDAISHTLLAIVHACLKERADIIHIHAVGPALLSWLARVLRPQAKVIVTFHCIDRHHQKWGQTAKRLLLLGEWMAMKCAHEVITVSKTLHQYAYEQYGRSTQYIPNGTNAVETQPALRITEQFDLRANDYILMVARLVPHKGAHHLIRAFRQLKTTKKLVFVGDSAFTDQYCQELKTLARGDNRIVFIGLQTRRVLAELYSNAYCVVLPSESEGLPLVLLEAAAYGKAIIASDIPGNLEIIESTGIRFQSGNVEALRDALRCMLAFPNVAADLGQRARAFVLARYQWDDIVRKTNELYSEMVPWYTPSRVKTSGAIR